MSVDLFGFEYDPSGAPLTQERLKEILRYDPATGEWRWLVKPRDGIQIGAKAGWGKERRHIELYGRQYVATRLAYFYMTGEWPPVEIEIDHKSGVSSNEKWSNLRPATRSQNQWNKLILDSNTSGVPGVKWNKSQQKWHAGISVEKKYFHLGSFDDFDDACQARWDAEDKYHGEYAARHSRPDYGALHILKGPDLFS